MSYPQDELQQLLSQRDVLSARIASLQAHSTRHPRNGISKTPMSRQMSHDVHRPRAVQPTRNLSHQSAPGMLRSSSGNIPFTATGPVPMLFPERVDDWVFNQPQTYTYERPPSDLPLVQELGFGEDPDEYLRRTASYDASNMLCGGIEMMHVNSSCSLLTDGAMTRTSSTNSTQSRCKQQLQRQIQHAARPLAPKAGGETMSRQSSCMVRIPSTTGTDDKVLAQIPKVPYQRPKHVRVYCQKCNDCPEGFRSDHELRRHDQRQHEKRVKRFVCREPPHLAPNDLRPVVPLSKCKACTVHQKQYNIYYNAAAHLRRAHFNPKRRGRGKNAKVQDRDERRGSKAGGDWPHIDELKKWWTEVEVLPDHEDDEGSEDEIMGVNDNMDLPLPLTLPHCQSQSSFDPFMLNDGSAFINPLFPQSYFEMNPVPYIGA